MKKLDQYHWRGRGFAVRTVSTIAIGALALLALVSRVHASSDARTPEFPAEVCDDIKVPAGHKVSFKAYAAGVQIYHWTTAGWVLKAPDAVLYADPGFKGEIGTHYGGPTWEANDGSAVRGSSPIRCVLSGSDIPWLRLNATSLEHPGLFANISYIQRVNTVGGVIPNYPGTTIGEEVSIPYTAEYYFYRQQ